MQKTKRKVTILVTNITQGTGYVLSYPDKQLNKRIKYRIPLYVVQVEGINRNGNRVSEIFSAIRFGVYKSYNGGRPKTVGLSDEQTHTLTWDDISTMSGEAWRVYDGFFIHEGPNYPLGNKRIFGSIGCIEICGVGEWDRFNKLIVELSGARNEYEVSNNRLLTAEYQSAVRPPLIPLKY